MCTGTNSRALCLGSILLPEYMADNGADKNFEVKTFAQWKSSTFCKLI